MKKPATLINLLFLFALLIIAGPAVSDVIIPESVESMIATSSGSSMVEILLSFEEDNHIYAPKINSFGKKLSRFQRYNKVIDRLDQNRKDLEALISPVLDQMKLKGTIESYKFFTVSNTVLINTTVENIDELITLPGAYLVNMNAPVSLITPVEDKKAQPQMAATLSNSALETLNVRELWKQGYTGKGSLICSFDTGVDGDHPALSDKWRGNNSSSASESWFAPRGDSLPFDNTGHGSHTMGVMVGSTGTDTIGVAPDAQWISAAVIDQGANLTATVADILSAFDWAINPDGDINTTNDIPDVINNSWGVPQSIFSDCNNTFWTAIDNVEAAGIVAIFAAGNEGPDPATIRNPADRASSPLNALSVGSINQNTLVVADFSSRGPSSCNNAIKPEVVVPGVNIYSAHKNGGYRVMSGTSMSAPFVSGLVALMRQYNPNASVEDIKNAIIQSTIDLGPDGEDNAYGHGLVDASKLIENLPVPNVPQVFVKNYLVQSGGDQYADPGEAASLFMTLNEPTGQMDSVDIWLTSYSNAITIAPDTLRFFFVEGSYYSTGINPFSVDISQTAISGESVEIMMIYSVPGFVNIDTTIMDFLIGHETPGQIFSNRYGDIELSASEFGQFGFGEGSIYQAGGSGFKFKEGENLLYEGGLIVGFNSQMVSDAIRDEGGQYKESDFLPRKSLSISAMESGEMASVVEFSDDGAALPIPIDIEQRIWGTTADYAICEFNIYNPYPQRLNDISVGLFLDFDLDRYSDLIGYDTLSGVLYQYNTATQTYVGIIGLSSGEFTIHVESNGSDSKAGFAKDDKYSLIKTSNLNIAPDSASDWYFSMSQSLDSFEAFETKSFAVALIAGESLNQLRGAAMIALNDYGLLLDADENEVSLPTELELAQNYPNPFNPQTTIRFTISSSQQVRLDVYNIDGQKVRSLYNDIANSGEHEIIWDGRNGNSQMVASGVYMYRLIIENGQSQTRKMILMK